jgi:membrane-associated phospholipid phosphatase
MPGIIAALGLSFFGFGLVFSFFLFEAAWAEADRAVFFFFNERLVPDSLFLYMTACANLRAFDLVSLLAMGGLYWLYFRKQDNPGKRRMICLGILMLLSGIVLKQAGHLLPLAHPSPTMVFPQVNRISSLTLLAAKDAARNSFPGDHGMMLMLFAAYMARFFGSRAFLAACVLAVVFSLPRIASGAHWFSDIYMGSLALVCIGAGCFLLTPACLFCLSRLERFLPPGLYPERRGGRTSTL